MTTLTIIGLIILAAWGWAKSYVRGLGIRKLHEYGELAAEAVEKTLEMRDNQYKYIYKRFEEVSEELEAANAAINTKDMYIRTYKIERNQNKLEIQQHGKYFYELINEYRSLAKEYARAANIENMNQYALQIDAKLAEYHDKFNGRVKQ